MHAVSWSRIVVFIASALVSVTSAATPQTRPNTANSIEAIWRVQEFVLYVHTPGHYHSCSSIEAKIVSILRAVGAAEVAVDMSCSGVTGNAVARVATRTPVPADSDSIRTATTFDARSELIARVHRTQLPTPETIERFFAEWRNVSLGRNRQLDIRPQDCDLLKGITQQILPHLSVRVVEERFTCDRVSKFPMSPKLIVEALTQTV